MSDALRLIAIAEIAGTPAWVTSDPTTYIGTSAQINVETAERLQAAGLVEPDYRDIFRWELNLTPAGWLEFLATTHVDTTRLVTAIRSTFERQGSPS